MLTIWFQIMLDEADGDLDIAVRRHNRGIARARRGEGQEYLEGVKRRRRRFIRNDGTSGAWRFLYEPRRTPGCCRTRRILRRTPTGQVSTRAPD